MPYIFVLAQSNGNFIVCLQHKNVKISIFYCFFGRFVGVSALCRAAGDSVGWESPLKALGVVLNYSDELKLAQLVSYNRILIDKTAIQVPHRPCFFVNIC